MRPTARRIFRLLFEFSVDAAIVLGGYYVGLLLRFDGEIPAASIETFRLAASFLVLFYLSVNWWSGVYRTEWRYGGARDVLVLLRSVLLVTALITLFNRTRAERDIPLSVNLIAGAFTLLLMLTWKLSPRWLALTQSRRRHSHSRRLLIVGAGNTGQLVAREFLQHHDWEYRPVCFVDDDPAKRGRRIHGLPVAGATSDLAHLVEQFDIDMVALAISSAGPGRVREVLTICEALGVPARIVPGLPELVESPRSASPLREVTVEDLLGRDAVEIDYSLCFESLHNKVVLITGAAGSVGSELARQVLRFRPSALHLLDNNESGLYDLHQELARDAGEIVIRLWPANVTDEGKLARLFAQSRPAVVFHAAAYKHVGMMEEHPDEAFRVNVLGTRAICRAAAITGVEKLVFITTDKAVRPVSVYGATKRIGELLVLAQAERSATVFCAVRFGNVIGSRGSVVPLFAKQIARGGPVVVTDPEAARYFLTIPEAVSLVIQAAAFARQGQMFMLDMGEEVRIQDLAEKMIRLRGLAPGADVPIIYSGLRPGEKVREELVADHEQTRPTHHPKVLLTFAGARPSLSALDTGIDAVTDLLDGSPQALVEQIAALARTGIQPDAETVRAERSTPLPL